MFQIKYRLGHICYRKVGYEEKFGVLTLVVFLHTDIIKKHHCKTNIFLAMHILKTKQNTRNYKSTKTNTLLATLII